LILLKLAILAASSIFFLAVTATALAGFLVLTGAPKPCIDRAMTPAAPPNGALQANWVDVIPRIAAGEAVALSVTEEQATMLANDHLPGRTDARTAVLPAARAWLGRLRDADPSLVPLRVGRASGRRHHGCARTQRGDEGAARRPGLTRDHRERAATAAHAARRLGAGRVAKARRTGHRMPCCLRPTTSSSSARA
jgi:hypothetical protein